MKASTLGTDGAFLKMVSDLHGFRDQNDPINISFWIISIRMVAVTAFLLREANCIYQGKTSMHAADLVTLVEAVHYSHMREFLVQIGSFPIVYCYIDWTITAPMQMVEFYLILSAAQTNISGSMFWRLLMGTAFMLVAGYRDEVAFLEAWTGHLINLCGLRGFICSGLPK